MKNKNIAVIAIAILIVLIGAYYYFGNESTENPSDDKVVSTSTDTSNLSPTDTTGVNTGVKNPTPAVASAYLKVGERKLINGVFITPIHLTLDSRCPSDVKCIQAGTTDINTLVQKGNVSQNVILSLNKSVLFSGKQITLTSVTPKKLSTQTLVESDYNFLITVK